LKKIKVGIIGTGFSPQKYQLPTLAREKLVELTAFCDIIPERAENAARRYGAPDSKVYADYRDLLKEPDIDTVYVCTSNRAHSYITIDALRAGKHVMCEKPMARNAAEAEQMLKTAKETGKKLSVHFQRRLFPECMVLKQMIQAGELGDIYYSKGMLIRRRGVPSWGDYLDKSIQGGGALLDCACHVLDMTLWLLNNYNPEFVFAVTYDMMGKIPGLINRWDDWDASRFSVEDMGFGLIKFKNGATFTIEASWVQNVVEEDNRYPLNLILCGTKAGADLSKGLRINGEKNRSLYEMNFDVSYKNVPKYRGEDISDTDLLTRDWIECIINDEQPFVKPEEALVVSKIVDGFYESAKTGTPYYF